MIPQHAGVVWQDSTDGKKTLDSATRHTEYLTMNVVQQMLIRHARQHPNATLDGYLRTLVQGVRGHVLEVGCSSGNLFRYYPKSVTRLLGVEPSAEARAAAAREASKLPFPASVTGLTPSAGIPVDSRSIDYVVCNEVLCSVTDPGQVLKDIRRILRTDGELRLFEHIASENGRGRLIQRMVDGLGWPKLLGGCHTSRRTPEAVRDAGFEWITLEHVWYARLLILRPAGPHILGRASLRQD